MAVATAAATWVLLLVGCMVHGTGSSLACPDWPTCFGTFFPEMKGGVEYEHSHRLVATGIGILTIALAVMLWRKRNVDSAARTTAKLGLVALGLVIFQGVLGGVTVLLQLPILVTLAHLTTSMCFFSLLAYIAIRTSPRREAIASERAAATPLRLVRPLVGATAAATLVQIILGGVVRHTNNGMACRTIPLCEGGELWPSHVGQQIQMGHRFYAVALAALIAYVAARVWRSAGGVHLRNVRLLAVASVALVAAQITLGLVSVAWNLPLIPVTAHLGVAALILLTHVALFAILPGARPARVFAEAAASPRLEPRATDASVVGA